MSLTIYAYFFRMPVGRLATHDAAALREFAAVYVTPEGLVTALAGLAILVRQSFWRSVTFVIPTLVFACFIFYKIRIIPEHFWMARRFLPVILPATCLLIGAAVASPLSATWRRAQPGLLRVAALVPSIVVLAFLSSQFFYATRPILDYVEYVGVIPRLEVLEGQFADDDLVLVEARDASDLHTLAVPLAYVYARNILLLSAREPDKQSFAEFLTWARGRYRRVLFRRWRWQSNPVADHDGHPRQCRSVLCSRVRTLVSDRTPRSTVETVRLRHLRARSAAGRSGRRASCRSARRA